MREPTAARCNPFENNPEIDTLLENVRLFAKRHQPCGRLWIDVPRAPARETTRTITAACLCGDTLEEIVGMPVVSRGAHVPRTPDAGSGGVAARDGSPAEAVRTQLRSTSATLHAWATHPRGVKGGSASKISLIDPTHPSLR
jgi:hypothetical protein